MLAVHADPNAVPTLPTQSTICDVTKAGVSNARLLSLCIPVGLACELPAVLPLSPLDLRTHTHTHTAYSPGVAAVPDAVGSLSPEGAVGVPDWAGSWKWVG